MRFTGDGRWRWTRSRPTGRCPLDRLRWPRWQFADEGLLMKTIELLAIFHGPNPRATQPVLVVQLDLPRGGRAGWASAVASMSAWSLDWCAVRVADTTVPVALHIVRLPADWMLGALNHSRRYLHAAGARAPSKPSAKAIRTSSSVRLAGIQIAAKCPLLRDRCSCIPCPSVSLPTSCSD